MEVDRSLVRLVEITSRNMKYELRRLMSNRDESVPRSMKFPSSSFLAIQTSRYSSFLERFMTRATVIPGEPKLWYSERRLSRVAGS